MGEWERKESGLLADETVVGGTFSEVLDGHGTVVLDGRSWLYWKEKKRKRKKRTYDGDKGTSDGKKNFAGGIIRMEYNAWGRKWGQLGMSRVGGVVHGKGDG